MTTRSRKLKRKLEPEPPPCTITKKLRQKLSRRRRQNISPVLLVAVSGENPPFSVDSSSASDFAAEVSCNSSRASIAGKGIANSRNESSIDSTRYHRRFEQQNDNEVEASESSCVDSSERSSKSLILKFKRETKNPKEHNARMESEITFTSLKFKSGRENKNANSNDGNLKSELNGNNVASFISGLRTTSSCEDERSRNNLILKFKSERESYKNPEQNDDVSEAPTKSEITSEEQFNSISNSTGNVNIKIASESNGNDVVSSSEDEKNKKKVNRALEFEYSEENCGDLIAQSITKQEEWDNYDVVVDLACSEDLRFSYCDDDEFSSDYVCSSQGTVFSELHSEIFGQCSQQELSDYSPTLLFVDSGSQFSEGSVGETPSPTYLLFYQYRNEFSTLASPAMNNASSDVEDDVNFVKFEDLDDEESYQMLRNRERRQGFWLNYGQRYLSATEFGETVLEQRSQMIHWIVEQCYRKQLRQETMFLAVNLLDRFLSKGYFKAKRNLQIVGIACLTLATRMEENQQYNRFYLKATKADAVTEKRVKYLAVLALSTHEQLCYWPSTIAAALVILACVEVDKNSSLKVKGIHVRSKDENLHECIENLEWLLRYVG